MLLFDEPLNGLDPEGVRWVRELFRRLAAEGRTVFVSSHLMSEMEHTADRLVVIGRGRLIADESVADFAARGAGQGAAAPGVTVRTTGPGPLADALRAAGGEVRPGDDAGTLLVTGLDPARIGALALDHRVPLLELTARTASLEEAFMALTADHADHSAGGPR